MAKTFAERMRDGDRIVEAMMEEAGGVVELPKVRETLSSAMEALFHQAEVLKQRDLSKPFKCPGCGEEIEKPLSAADVARAMAYTAKVVDEVYRLKEFAAGRADSRPEVTGGALLEYLSDEQVKQFEEWVEAGKARRAIPIMPKGVSVQ